MERQHIKRDDELANLELLVWGRMPTVLSWRSVVTI